MIKAVLWGAILAAAAAATDYHVGPGQTYTQIGQVPWYALQAGDTVYIHYRSTPYYEKFLISGRGTPTQWIRVLGVPGPNGELPIISGNGAVTSKNSHYHWQDPTGGSAIQWDGVIQVAVRADNADGTSPALPGYIEIANLQVQDGYSTYRFTAENGATATYDSFAACIYARSAQHLLIRNNVLTNCGQGFYNWTGDGSSGGNTWWDGVQIDTVLRGNYFYNNGNTSSYTEHQSYTESSGVTIENNRYGAPRAGMLGSQLKDRSAGTVIRYNYIEQSPLGWSLDLVEPEESYYTLGTLATYKQAFVYGNLMINKGVADPNVVHWNEDHQMGHGRATLTGGTLYFYDNTLLTVANQSDMSTYSLFNTTWGGYDCPPSKPPGVIDVRNNVIATLPRTAGSPVPTMKFGYCGTENFTFGTNWVSPGYFFGTGGTVTGTSNILSPSANDPGFLNVASNDLHLAPGSGLVGKGGSLAAAVTSNSLGIDARATQQYVYHLQTAARASGGGAGGDLGALEGNTATGCTYSASPETAAYGADASTGTVSVTAGSSCGWSASSNAAWLGISAGASGTGYGLVSYTVAANTGTAARTGTLSVAGTTVTITQAGQPTCTYSLSAAEAAVGAEGGPGSIGITSGSGCGWTAASGAAWITASGSGTGNGTVNYSVAANTASTSRSGSITIAGKVFTITQSGVACSYTLTGTSASVGAEGGPGSFGVSSGSGCSWSAASGAAWITASGSGTGNGTVNYSAAANTGSTSRTGTITIAGKVFTITQAGAACSYTLTGTSASVGAEGGPGSIGITSGGGCSWTAASGAAWITASGSGTGNGTVNYSVAANSASTSRSGSITIAGKVFTITQASAACSYTLAGTSASIGAEGGPGSIGITSGSGCNWTAASGAAWITASGSGTGNGTVNYSVAANTAASARTGTVTIAGQIFTITQSGTSCSYTVSATGTSVAAGGGMGSLTVSSGTGCGWTASSGTGWITMSSAGGTGNGVLSFSVPANPSMSPRTGALVVAGTTISITQAGQPACTYTLSPPAMSMPAEGGSGSLDVTSPAGCSWNPARTVEWITVSGAGRSANGTLAFSVAANTGASPRTGGINIAGQIFTITQAGQQGCSYSLSGSGTSLPAGGGAGSIGVSSSGGCGWTAASGALWITLSGASGTGNGTVGYSVTANTASAARTGTITIAGQVFTITQAGQQQCTYGLSATGDTLAASGGGGSITVTSVAGCSWTALSGASWITVSGAGSGNGAVSYTVAANPDYTARMGTVAIGGQTFTINQAGQTAVQQAGCAFTLSMSGVTIGQGGGAGTFWVAGPAGCGWTAVSTVPWITMSAGGAGTGTVTYTVAPNTATTTPRTGAILAGGQTFTINQAGGVCSYALSPASTSFESDGGLGTIGVISPAGCSWIPARGTTWIHVSGASRSGTGTLSYSVDPNPDADARTGTINIGGQIFTIFQAGL